MSANRKSFIWTMQEDEILIDFVKNHQPLYNVKCKDYRKTQMKLNLWRELANVIKGKTDIECTKRWAYVRDYYVRRKGKGGTNEAAKRRAEKLSFLNSCSAAKRSTIENSDENHSENVDLKEKEEEELSFSEMPAKGPKNIVKDQEISPENSKSSSKRQKTSFNLKERLKKIPQEGQSEEQDETDLFFASMAKSVKKLPERERVCVRLEVGNIVGNAELRYLDNDCNRPTSSASGSSSNFTSDCKNEVFDTL